MTYDFAIIGGGIAGVSAAARLAPLGKTLLLESETALAYHASGRSAALFEEFYGAPSVVALNQAGKDFFFTTPNLLSDRGIMIVGKSGEQDQFTTDAAQFQMSHITPTEAQAIVPILDTDKITLAAHSTGAKDIDTDLLIQTFARTARANGADLQTGKKVTQISRTKTGWTIQSGDKSFDCKLLINAAGAWVDEIAALAGIPPIGVQPYRRSMARIPAPGGHDLKHWPMLFGVGESWYAKPDAGQLIVSPADAFPMPPHDAYADDMTLAEGIDRYSDCVTTEVTRLTSSWAGLRTFAPDRTLVIGFAPADPAFFWLAGQGGYGFQTSPGASTLARDLIAGTQPELDPETVKTLSPARFAK